MLGDQFGRALKNGEIKVVYDSGGFHACYYDWMLPLAPRTWTWILQPALDHATRVLDQSHPGVMELESIITALGHLPPRTETDPDLVRAPPAGEGSDQGPVSALAGNCVEVRSGHKCVAGRSQRAPR